MTKQSVATCALAAFMLCIAAFAEAKGKVIYTGEIAKKVQGYAGTTPLNITIEDGIITKIEALPCNETPKYYKRAQKAIFPQYIGKTVSQALKIKPEPPAPPILQKPSSPTLKSGSTTIKNPPRKSEPLGVARLVIIFEQGDSPLSKKMAFGVEG